MVALVVKAMAKKPKVSRSLPYYFEPPVETRPERLPLHDPNWTWNQFEAFSRDFVGHLPGVIRCHHYGKGGSLQKGIDLYADFENGERWTFQCKQRKVFRKTHVEKTIAKNTYVADRHVILVSVELGSEARDACDQHPRWDAWDVRDIAIEVRKLRSSNPDAARRIVEDHFGRDWRSAFLGVRGLSTFLSPYDFFEKFLNPANIFNHTLDMVGRRDKLARLNEFVASDRHRVLLLRGRGGIGKTKLLHAFSQGSSSLHSAFSLRFVPDGAPVTRESADELLSAPLVIIFDDVHRRDLDELGVLLAIAHQRKEPIKLILSLRPNGYNAVYTRLIQAGFDISEIDKVVDLHELERNDVKELAAQVLGTRHGRFADRLVEATKDCPLVTVIGGRLLVEKTVDPELLERQGEFQQAVLSKFRDEIVGKVGDQIEQTLCRSLLNLLAAIMPFGSLEGTIGEAAADFLKTDQPTLIQAIDHLETVGVLYRRGSSVRITPDVLADHILHNACLTAEGRHTGFIRAVFVRFGNLCLAQLLRNLGELDWRINRTDPSTSVDLLSEVWGEIAGQFAAADAQIRARILDALTDFSYYQPRRILDLCEFAMRNPTDEVEDRDQPYRICHRHVLAKLPALLRGVAYSLEWLPRTCDLLWELGRDDDRPWKANLDDATGVLAKLASYYPDKPVRYNEIVVQRVEQWLESADSARYIGKVCDILDHLLEKTGHTSDVDEEMFSLKPFLVNEPNTRQARDRVINLLEKQLFSEDPKAVLRAVKSFRKVLHNPMPIGNPQVSQEVCAVWEPEQLRVLEIMGRLLRKHRFPIATYRALGGIRWTAHFNSNPRVSVRAAQIRDSITPDFQLQLTDLLLGDHQSLVEDENYEVDVSSSLAKRAERLKERSVLLSEQIIREYPDPLNGLNMLSDCLDLIRLDEHPGIPATFLSTIGDVNLEYAHGLCEAILESPGRSLASCFAFLVTPIRRLAPELGLALLRRALASEQPVLRRSVACFYSYPAWTNWVLDEDVGIIESLVGASDQYIRMLAIGGIRNLGKSRPDAAKGLALSIELNGSAQVAKELFLHLELGIGVSLAEFSDEEIDRLVTKLSTVGSLEDHWINQFLVLASKRRPVSVLRMLLARIDTLEWDAMRNIRALPTLGFDLELDGLPKHSSYQSMLREVRDRTLGPKRPAKEFMIPQLFREITLGFSTDFLPILDEWLESKEDEKVKAVASLLKESPPSFIFTHTKFVGRLLGIAHDIGEKCFDHVSRALYSSSITQGRHGFRGQPFPKDIALKDSASAIAKSCESGSPQWRFYDSLAKHAEDEIKRSLDSAR